MPGGAKPSDGSSAPASARGNTLYDILGIAQTATTVEVTSAYRKLALDYHPDRAGGSTEKFQELQRAYEVLNNPNNRAKYDTLLKGKPNLRGFKRPPKLEKVDNAVYALLADLAFYEFEASASKLRCSFHYGDGIECNGERGSFIGLAGDGNFYWSVNGRGYATSLCNAESDMALSNIRIVYRSNMGLRKKPLERSRAGNYAAAQPRSSTRQSASSSQSTGSPQLSNAAAGGHRLSEAERMREQLRNKERHRSATKRLETIEREESDARNDLERELWEDFCMLHTNLEACMRCVRLGLPVTMDFARFMGYMSPQEVPLVMIGAMPSVASTIDSPQAAALWVDPLEGDTDSDGLGGDNNNDNTKNNNNGNDFAFEEVPDVADAAQRTKSPSSAPSRSMSASSSDAASDGDSCRARPTAAPNALNETRYTAAYVSPQASGSAPMVSTAVHPTISSASSLGHKPYSPGQPTHLASKSWQSSPAATPLPAAPSGGSANPRGSVADQYPVPHAPQTIHAVPTPPPPAQSNSTAGSHVRVPPTSGAQRGSTTSLPLEGDSHGRLASYQDSGRVSRGSLPEVEPPSSTALLQPVSPALATTYAAGAAEATPPDTRESTADRFVSLLQATHDGPHVSRSAAKDRSATPPRPLYPWSADHPNQRDAQARPVLYEAIPDPTAGGTVERDTGHSSSPVVTAPVSQHHGGSADAAAARGSLGSRSTPSPSPQAARERTPALASAHGLATAASAELPHVNNPTCATSSPEDSTRPPSHTHASGEEAPRILKFRPSTGHAAVAVPGQTPEADASISPRPLNPPRPVEQRKPSTASAEASGRSVPAQSLSHGETGDPHVSVSGFSAGTVSHSLEDGPRVSGQRSPRTVRSSNNAALSQETPMRHVDTVVNSGRTPASGNASRLTTLPSEDFISPVDFSAVRDRNDSAVSASGELAPSASTGGHSTGQRVTLAPLRLSAAREDGALRSGRDAEVDAALLSPNAQAAAAERKRRLAKGRVTPRYMLATEAHTRRSSLLPSDASLSGAPTQSPRVESIHAYNSMTVDQMLAEEEDFMNSFAKTKRAI